MSEHLPHRHEQLPKGYDQLLVVKADEATLSLQGLNYFVGISEEKVGARGISMSLIVIPPRGQAEAHYHVDTETAIYFLRGHVMNYFGDNLEFVVESGPGDFVFIPPGVIHKPVNMSDTEPAVVVMARNTAKAEVVVHAQVIQ